MVARGMRELVTELYHSVSRVDRVRVEIIRGHILLSPTRFDQAVRLVGEVVSHPYGSVAIADKPDWYGEAGVPLFLLVDPRDGSWRLLSRPDSRRYRARVDGVFGEEIVLPEPLDFALQTKEFKRYE